MKRKEKVYRLRGTERERESEEGLGRDEIKYVDAGLGKRVC